MTRGKSVEELEKSEQGYQIKKEKGRLATGTQIEKT
jgi:hypothetical protein